MKTIILSWENAYENNYIRKFMEENDIDDVLSLFEGDPDMIRVNNSKICYVTFENEDETIIVYADFSYLLEDKDIPKLQKMLETFVEDWAILHDNYVKIDNQTWEAFDELENGIAYRGGSGYSYTIWKYLN